MTAMLFKGIGSTSYNHIRTNEAQLNNGLLGKQLERNFHFGSTFPCISMMGTASLRIPINSGINDELFP